MRQIFIRLGEQFLAFGPKGLLGLLLFLFFWLAGGLAGRLLNRIGRRMDQERQEVLQLAGSATKVTLILLGAVTGLGTMGINVSALVAGLGLTGFALGFALRDAFWRGP